MAIECRGPMASGNLGASYLSPLFAATQERLGRHPSVISEGQQTAPLRSRLSRASGQCAGRNGKRPSITDFHGLKPVQPSCPTQLHNDGLRLV
jgi:hypothetical protein